MKISSFFKTIAIATMLVPSLAFAQEPSSPAQDSIQPILDAYQAQDYQQAILLADKHLETSPDDLRVLNILGASLAQADQNERAETVLLKLKEKMPNDSSVMANLCYVQVQNKRKQAIVDTCLEAVRLNANNAELLHLTGQQLEAAKRPDEARDMYLKAWELEPKNLVYLTAVTAIDFHKQDYQKAYELTQKALNAGSTSPILFINIINASNHLGKYEESIQWAEKGLTITNDDSILFGKAEALYHLGKFEEARNIYQKDMKPSDIKARPKTAFMYARTLLALACTTAQASSCQTNNEDRCCGDERTALEVLTQIADDNKMKAEKDFPVYLGIAQTLNGNLDNAEAILTKASTGNTDNAIALAALSVALYQYGDNRDRQAARRYYRQALDSSPQIADAEFIRNTKAWPPRLLDILQKVQQDSQTEDKPEPKKSGCSCETQSNHSPVSLAMILSFLAALFGMIILRRKSA